MYFTLLTFHSRRDGEYVALDRLRPADAHEAQEWHDEPATGSLWIRRAPLAVLVE